MHTFACPLHVKEIKEKSSNFLFCALIATHTKKTILLFFASVNHSLRLSELFHVQTHFLITNNCPERFFLSIPKVDCTVSSIFMANHSVFFLLMSFSLLFCSSSNFCKNEVRKRLDWKGGGGGVGGTAARMHFSQKSILQSLTFLEEGRVFGNCSFSSFFFFLVLLLLLLVQILPGSGSTACLGHDRISLFF